MNLLRYMDPNADGDLTIAEVEDAIERSNQGETADQLLLERNQATLCRLEEVRALRVASAV